MTTIDKEALKLKLTEKYNKNPKGIYGNIRIKTYGVNNVKGQVIKGVTKNTDLKDIHFMAWEVAQEDKYNKQINKHLYEKEDIEDYRKPIDSVSAGIGSLVIHNKTLTDEEIKQDLEFGKAINNYDGMPPYNSELVPDLGELEGIYSDESTDLPYLNRKHSTKFHRDLCYGRLREEIPYGSMFFINLDPKVWYSSNSSIVSVGWEADDNFNKYITYVESWNVDLECKTVTFRTRDDVETIPFDFWDNNTEIPVSITLYAKDKKGRIGSETFNIKLVKPMVFGLITLLGKKSGTGADMKSNQDWSYSNGGRWAFLRYINRTPEELNISQWRSGFRFKSELACIPKKFVYSDDLSNVIELETEVYIPSGCDQEFYECKDIKGVTHKLRRPIRYGEIHDPKDYLKLAESGFSGSYKNISTTNEVRVCNISGPGGPGQSIIKRHLWEIPSKNHGFTILYLYGCGVLLYDKNRKKFQIVKDFNNTSYDNTTLSGVQNMGVTLSKTIELELGKTYLFKITASDVFNGDSVYYRIQYTEFSTTTTTTWVDILTEDEIKQYFKRTGINPITISTGTLTTTQTSVRYYKTDCDLINHCISWNEEEYGGIKSIPATSKTENDFNSNVFDYFNFCELEIKEKGINSNYSPRCPDIEFKNRDNMFMTSTIFNETVDGADNIRDSAYGQFNVSAQNIVEGFIDAPEMIYDRETNKWILPKSKLTQFLDKESGLPYCSDYRRMVKVDPRKQVDNTTLEGRTSIVQDSINYELQFQGLGKKPKLVSPNNKEWNSRDNYMYDTFYYFPRYHQINIDVVTRNSVKNTSCRWRVELLSMGKFKINPQEIINEVNPLLSPNEIVDTVETFEVDVSKIHNDIGKTIGSAKIISNTEVLSRPHRAFRARTGTSGDFNERFLTGYWLSSYPVQYKKAGWDTYGDLILEDYNAISSGDNINSNVTFVAQPQQVTESQIENADACVTGGAPIKYQSGRRPQVVANKNDRDPALVTKLAKRRFHIKPSTVSDKQTWTNVVGVKNNQIFDCELQLLNLEFGGPHNFNSNSTFFKKAVLPGNSNYGPVTKTLEYFESANIDGDVGFKNPLGGVGSTEYCVDYSIKNNSEKYFSIRHSCHPIIRYEYFDYTKHNASVSQGMSQAGYNSQYGGERTDNAYGGFCSAYRGQEYFGHWTGGQSTATETIVSDPAQRKIEKYYFPYDADTTIGIHLPEKGVKIYEMTYPELTSKNSLGIFSYKPGTYMADNTQLCDVRTTEKYLSNSNLYRGGRTFYLNYGGVKIENPDTVSDDKICVMSNPTHNTYNNNISNCYDSFNGHSVGYMYLCIPDEFGPNQFCPYVTEGLNEFNPSGFTDDYSKLESFYDSL